MACERGIKFLLNEYEYYNQTQETLISGVTPADIVCNDLCYADIVATNRYQTYFLGTHHYEFFEIADTVAIFNLRDTLEAAAGGGTYITVFAADNPTFTVNVEQQTFAVTIGDLVGINNKDWYGNLTDFTAKKPYWGVRIFTDIPTGRPVRKIMLGKSLSFSRHPVYPAQFNLITDSIEAVRSTFQIRLSYLALTDIDKIELIERLIADQDFVQGTLIDENDDLLLGFKTMMFSLIDADISIRKSLSGIDLNLNIDEVL